MYEGKILQTGHGEGQGDDTGDGLSALSWAEISARLAAAHDFRRLMGRGGQDGACSFNPASARHIAELGAALGPALGEGKPGIHPIALSDGKMTDSMDFATHDDAKDDRGSE